MRVLVLATEGTIGSAGRYLSSFLLLPHSPSWIPLFLHALSFSKTVTYFCFGVHTPVSLGPMPQIPGFKKCISSMLLFSVMDEYQWCLYCLDKAHIAACCLICKTILHCTWDAHEHCLHKYLMEEETQGAL